jgi:hypothetical protein
MENLGGTMQGGGLEPQILLKLAKNGDAGVAGPDALCGHWIQSELLDPGFVMNRAERIGRVLVKARIDPFKRKLKHSLLLREHPLLGRLYCTASLIGWGSLRAFAAVFPHRASWFEWLCRSIERTTTCREYLRLAGRMHEYRIQFRWPMRAGDS